MSTTVYMHSVIHLHRIGRDFSVINRYSFINEILLASKSSAMTQDPTYLSEFGLSGGHLLNTSILCSL